MAVIKISIPDDVLDKIRVLAEKEYMSVQDYFRYKTCGIIPDKFDVEEAYEKALAKYKTGDVFTLPDIYGDEWSKLAPRMTGIFGKRFFNYVETKDEIEFVGMSDDRRRATYRIK